MRAISGTADEAAPTPMSFTLRWRAQPHRLSWLSSWVGGRRLAALLAGRVNVLSGRGCAVQTEVPNQPALVRAALPTRRPAI